MITPRKELRDITYMSTAPKVTIEQVEAAIKGETYTLLPNGRTTICQLTLDNGFTVEGQSACVSIENYNAELGNKIARTNALEKVWMVLGFRLADSLMAKLNQMPDDFAGRLKVEQEELLVKLSALTRFLSQPEIEIPEEQHQLLVRQHKLMTDYASVLQERLDLLGSKT